MKEQKFSAKIGGKEIIIETGKLAQQANASCTVRCGDTTVLATVVMSNDVRPGLNFFPLMVDFEEKLFAAGRIKGSRFVKRDGRPTDEAVLTSRFIDRAIRPLFDQRIINDVQVIITVLSFDEENDPDVLGLIGASCAIHISDIPWDGPIGCVRVSKLESGYVFNGTYAEREKSQFDLDVAGTAKKVVMIEAKAHETSENEIREAFVEGQKILGDICKLIEKVKKAAGKEKIDPFTPKTDEERTVFERKAEVEKIAKDYMREQMKKIMFDGNKTRTKKERAAQMADIKNALGDYLLEKEMSKDEISFAKGLMYDFSQNVATEMILESDTRVDGRALDEVRKLTIETQLLPRVHGSCHFKRGGTQVLSVCTLGAPGDKQTLDGMEIVGEKRFMHHYSFPPFSVGEAKPMRGPGRRDIGHGALAEKALDFMIPAAEDFPYTILVNSEVLGSNGSSSMASTCGCTLALMDAGVPIKAPVAGIAMGLASEGENWKVVTDIMDLEDGEGGMDFKITGTEKGITAIQMDTKTHGLTQEMIDQTLKQSKQARLQILKEMADVLPAPREELSPFAPRILKITIDPEKIRDVIGPGGKIINEIIEKTGVAGIDIEQSGLIMITSKDGESGEKALEWINNLTRDPKPGETFDGEVVRIMDFGAFVQILPGKDGMVHVSELAPWRVEKVADIVKMGDKVKVKVIEIDSMGRVNLSMKQAEGNVYTEEMKKKAQQGPPPRQGDRNNNDRRGRSSSGSRPPRRPSSR
ncbi:MAG: polyribonucleotide nucleotidyltransferase [Patescibacteria group bacterium]